MLPQRRKVQSGRAKQRIGQDNLSLPFDIGKLKGIDMNEVEDETLRVNWNDILDGYEESMDFLKEVFVRR